MTRPRQGEGISHVNLLGEYVKLAIERDRMRATIEQSKAQRAGEVAHASRLVEILGSLLRGDERYYLTWHDRGSQHSQIVNDIRKFLAASPAILKAMHGERPPLVASNSPHSSEAERALWEREVGGSIPSAETTP